MGPVSKKILLVEDQDVVAHVLVLAMTELGHIVQHASMGAAAIACLPTFTPDVAIVDLGLPDVPGEQVAAHVRASNAGVRIIGVTGRLASALPAQQRALFDEVLQKPFALDDLLPLL
jgi:two-component system CheB/CheR fusion protein